MNAKKDEKPLTFEQAVEELETIIERIESGEVGLEDSLTAYENGMKLITHCRKVLDRAETRIEELTADDQSPPPESDDDTDNHD